MNDDLQPCKFIVISSDNAAATWLLDRIDSIPGAQGHMALLYEDFRRAPPRAGCNDYPRFVEIGKRFGHGRRPGALFGYLDQLYSRPGVIGFKVIYCQLRNYPELMPYIALRRLHVVHLLREDPLDSVLARLLNDRSGENRPSTEDAHSAKKSVSLDPVLVSARCRRFTRKQRVLNTVLHALPVPFKEVSYENLRHNEVAFQSLCSFLGMTADKACLADPDPEAFRRATDIATVSNYQQIRAVVNQVYPERPY